MKIIQWVGNEFFHADRQTGIQRGLKKLRVNFSNFDNVSDKNHFSAENETRECGKTKIQMSLDNEITPKF
jgi:hypothetical protein